MRRIIESGFVAGIDLTPAEREALERVAVDSGLGLHRFPEQTADYLSKIVTAALRAVPRLAGEGRDRLAGFAEWVMRQHTGTIDGCDIEEAAVRFGLMDAVTCDGTCDGCEGAVPGEDTCYRPHRLLNNEGSAE